jgi:hypothetical protein
MSVSPARVNETKKLDSVPGMTMKAALSGGLEQLLFSFPVIQSALNGGNRYQSMRELGRKTRACASIEKTIFENRRVPTYGGPHFFLFSSACRGVLLRTRLSVLERGPSQRRKNWLPWLRRPGASMERLVGSFVNRKDPSLRQSQHDKKVIQ